MGKMEKSEKNYSNNYANHWYKSVSLVMGKITCESDLILF